MRSRTVRWGVFGVSSLLGALACSGTNLNEVGDLASTAGHGGSEVVGAGGAFGEAGTRLGEAGSSGGLETDGGGGGVHLAEAGAAGAVGVAAPGGGAAGEGGQPGNGELVCPACSVVVTGQDIRGIAANDQKVFWVDYGTSDKLGNYKNDGRLLTRSLDGGATTVLADSLAGPESIGLSAGYAYVFLDRRDSAGLPLGVIRVPLADTAAQPLQGLANTTTWWPGYGSQIFASTPGYEYWTWNGVVYRIAQTDGAAVEPFLQHQTQRLFADDTFLYFADYLTDGGLWMAPLAGGGQTKLTESANSLLQLAGDYLYGIESPTTVHDTAAYLTRMTKTGGAWKRFAQINSLPTQLDVVGDSVLTDEPTNGTRRILHRSLVSDTVSVLATEASTSPGRWSGWALSRVGLFFADEKGLYLTPTAAP